jgi:hypothetical protein
MLLCLYQNVVDCESADVVGGGTVLFVPERMNIAVAAVGGGGGGATSVGVDDIGGGRRTAVPYLP